jgi:membrane-associated protein
MDVLTGLLDLMLHFDKFLSAIIQMFGPFTYLILFLIVFAETGLVVTPFLPGDSLLFITGAFAGAGTLDIVILYAVFVAAAVLGDTANYWIGHSFGPMICEIPEKKNKSVINRLLSKVLRKEHVDEAHSFFEKYGGTAIILARFVPIVRTFVPCIAGIGKMSYRKFLLYNVIGGVAWITMFLFAGYFFGTLPFVQENLSVITIGIIVLTLIPSGLKVLQGLMRRKRM